MHMYVWAQGNTETSYMYQDSTRNQLSWVWKAPFSAGLYLVKHLDKLLYYLFSREAFIAQTVTHIVIIINSRKWVVSPESVLEKLLIIFTLALLFSLVKKTLTLPRPADTPSAE